MSKLIYFRDRHDAKHVMTVVAEIAASHGYINHAGPNPGAGNVAELLAAIASGEVATVLLADTPRDMAIDWLRSQSMAIIHPALAEALTAIADALDEARQRER